MMKYRKRPIEVDAVQYEGHGCFVRGGRVPDWIFDALEARVLTATNGTDPFRIKTLEGELTVSPNDWIIRGVNGELYPCKPDVFAKTYDSVE